MRRPGLLVRAHELTAERESRVGAENFDGTGF